MDSRLVALKLFLNDLQIPSDIRTIGERKRIQKAIYLGQAARADLGYRFGWYIRGPYSPSLAQDYYSLAESIASGERDHEERDLREPIKEQLRRVRAILQPSEGVHLSQEDWLELLSSIHYLRIVRGLEAGDAIEILRREKPGLVQYAPIAQERLGEANLLP